MTDDRKSGFALIAGSFGGLLTMAIHPTAAGAVTAAQIRWVGTHSAVAHSLAMVSFLVMFLGACGLMRRLSAPDRLAFAGLVSYGFAAVAVLIGTAVSGFIVPALLRAMVADVASAAPVWHIVVISIFQINQAFSRIYTVAASVSIALWSICGLRRGGLGRGVALYGCVAAPVLIGAIESGRLRMDVHGMTVVVLGQAIWFLWAGAQMCSLEIGPLREL